MKNELVVRNWRDGVPASAKNLTTNGQYLYSYDLLIGMTLKGEKVVYDYTASGEYVSQTTSCHVGIARRYADRVCQPGYPIG